MWKGFRGYQEEARRLTVGARNFDQSGKTQVYSA
jgi:hypothetical protein